MSVTDEQLQKVIKTNLDTSLFISTATDFVTGQLQSTGIPLDPIILYFAAHLVVLSDEFGGLRRSRLGEADESYKVPGDKDTGLASTRFGQMVLLLDTSGTLAGLSANKGITALFSVVDQGNRDSYVEDVNVNSTDE